MVCKGMKLLLLLSVLFILNCKESGREANASGSEQSTNLVERPIQSPNFSLASLDDVIVSLDHYEGKFLVIHIATTWCPFCNAEAPYLEKLFQDYQGKNVEVLLIDVKEPKELVKEKLQRKYNLTFPILLDIDGDVAASFAPKDVLPDLSRDEVMLASNLLIDPDGNIQFMSLLDSKNFDAELHHLKSKLDELL